MGKELLAANYLLPYAIAMLMRLWGGGLTEAKLFASLFLTFVLLPIVYIFLNIKISKMIMLSSLGSALVMFTGLIQIIVASLIIRLVSGVILRFDLKTINLYVVEIGYYIFISLIYFLIKKDDNIQLTGARK